MVKFSEEVALLNECENVLNNKRFGFLKIFVEFPSELQMNSRSLRELCTK